MWGGGVKGLAIAVAAALALAACTGVPLPAPTPTPEPPTPTPAPTATAVPTPPPPTPTPTPRPTATPTPTPTPAPTPTPTPLPTATPMPGSVYRNTLYGFAVTYPLGWTAVETDRPSPVATFSTSAADLTGQATILYYPERLKPSAIAERELAPLAGLSAFRTLSQSDITLTDGTEAYQVLYGFGTGQEERRGALVIAARGTQALFIQVDGGRSLFESNLDRVDAFLTSLRLEEPAPFGLARKDSLVLALDRGPITLDPAIAQESQSIHYVSQVFSGLVGLGPDLTVVPDLAAWERSPDGRTYTFRIRENARFHSGRAVTSRDVVYSWERAASPALKSPTARTYLEDIVGMTDVLEGKAQHATGLAAVDDRTLRVTIDAPKVYFLSKLTHAVAFVVDEENVKAGQLWWEKPNGTGPFRLKEWTPDVAMHLERSDVYYGSPAKVPHVVYRFHSGFPVRMFEDGEVDAAFLSLDEVNTLREEKSALVDQVVASPQLSIHFVGFNTSVPPFNDPLVRRAFLLALDRKAIVEETLAGIGKLAHGFLPPGLPGYDPAIAPFPYSPVEAKALLAQSSYGGPEKLPEIVVTVSGGVGPDLVRMAQMWKDNLGVSVKARVLPSSVYYYDLAQRVENMYDYGWVADYPDPHNFLDVLFHTGADNNVGQFGAPDVDALLEQARVETDSAKRTALYQEVERIVVARAAAIPLWFGQDRLLVKPYVEGFRVDPQGQVDLSAVSLKGQR